MCECIPLLVMIRERCTLLGCMWVERVSCHIRINCEKRKHRKGSDRVRWKDITSINLICQKANNNLGKEINYGWQPKESCELRKRFVQKTRKWMSPGERKSRWWCVCDLAVCGKKVLLLWDAVGGEMCLCISSCCSVSSPSFRFRQVWESANVKLSGG